MKWDAFKICATFFSPDFFFIFVATFLKGHVLPAGLLKHVQGTVSLWYT